MSGQSAVPSFESLELFYKETYSVAVQEVRPAGRLGAVMLDVNQSAGDWSDAPTPDLFLAVLTSEATPTVFDCGGGRRRALMRRNDFALVPPHFATTFLVDSAHTLRILAVPYAKLRAFGGEDAALPTDGDFGRLHAGFNRDRELVTSIDRLWAEADSGNVHGTLWADGALLQIAARLLTLRSTPQRSLAARLAPWQVVRIEAMLRADLAHDHRLEELAGAVGLSAAYFCRAYASTVGEPPHRQLQRLRMEAAAARLATTQEPIGAIAAAVGYDDPSHFARLFRRQFGESPSQFRRERASPKSSISAADC